LITGNLFRCLQAGTSVTVWKDHEVPEEREPETVKKEGGEEVH